MDKKINAILQERLTNELNHLSPEGRFFSTDYISRLYRDLFGIGEDHRFDQAFDIVAFGQGNEIVKMNSLQSSSLLSLLFFYPLFKNSSNCLIIDGVSYNECFFEIKNKVIRFPSCIDVVLWSEKEKKLLFLESKFTEYTEVANKDEYGKSYYPLYKMLKKWGILPEEFELSERNDKFIIQLPKDKREYIQGIKQTISHLIGIIRGPYYPSGQHNEKEIQFIKKFDKHYYQEAKELEFSTILFELNQGEEKERFNNYKNLYENIIIKNHKEIIDCIKNNWDGLLSDQEKGRLKITDKILTYQNLSKQNPEYMQNLSRRIKQFYGL